MNGRIVAVLILCASFLVLLYGVISIPASVWRIISDWEMIVIALGVAVSFATLLVAYWVHSDYDYNQEQWDEVNDRLRKIEGYIEDKTRAERLSKNEKEKEQ
jgi:uncharacterized metal-binding protein